MSDAGTLLETEDGETRAWFDLPDGTYELVHKPGLCVLRRDTDTPEQRRDFIALNFRGCIIVRWNLGEMPPTDKEIMIL